MQAILIPETDWKEIPITHGKVAIVDAADYKYLSQWRWQAVFEYRSWRVRTMINGRPVYMHRLVYSRHFRAQAFGGKIPPETLLESPAFVHNKNGNRLDNRSGESLGGGRFRPPTLDNLQSNGTVKIVQTPIVMRDLRADTLSANSLPLRRDFLSSVRGGIIPPLNSRDGIDTVGRINFLLSQRLRIAFRVKDAIALTNQIPTAPVTELATRIDIECRRGDAPPCELSALTIQLQEIMEVMKP